MHIKYLLITKQKYAETKKTRYFRQPKRSPPYFTLVQNEGIILVYCTIFFKVTIANKLK